MKLAQWSIILGASSMALAAVSPDSSDDKSSLQRRALESSEQDVHMFARSPIPPVNMTPEEKAILKSMEEERDKLKDALEKAKQRETELNQRSKDEGLDQASQLSPERKNTGMILFRNISGVQSY
ncbi:hypothetical protein MT418_007820 [Batrachochytrium dendrobatidis]